MHVQQGILDGVPAAARYLSFSLEPGADVAHGLRRLAGCVDGGRTVAGLGLSCVLALGRAVPGLRDMPTFAMPGCEIPSTPAALWLWLRGDDRGELYHRARDLGQALAPVFRLEQSIDAFRYDVGRDLTGYEDGTENPEGDEAQAAAVVSGRGTGMDGSSFVAVQQWIHRFERFDAMSGEQRDAAIGRRRDTNEELEDAPASAHVKRTAQESFSPEAFVVRRSMPFAEGGSAGLVFVAFGASLDRFEAQLRRMSGMEDGVIDALFGFTRPVTGACYWCPPVRDGRLDLSLLGL
jgi:putative iron-dependent peroxidase